MIAVSRSVEPLQNLKLECPNLEIIAVDLSSWSETQEALKNIRKIDGLVNNAGIAIIKPFGEFDEKDFDEYERFKIY